MGEYNYILHHKPGITNRADALSRRPDYPMVDQQGQEQLLDDKVFARGLEVSDIDQIIHHIQEQHPEELKEIRKNHDLEKQSDTWQNQGASLLWETTTLNEG